MTPTLAPAQPTAKTTLDETLASSPDTASKAATADTVSPKATREKTGLSPEAMADLMGMSANGYRAWEAGNRSPGGPAWRLLGLIAANPEETTARLNAL